MKKCIFKGICFGLTSGIITTLGLIIGLHSFSGSKLIILGGIITIAVADAFSDALGMHIAEESHEKNHKDVWNATIATFFSKLLFASTFIIPVVAFELSTAIVISLAWGLSLLAVLSYFIAKDNKENPAKVIAEHLGIAIIVIIITHYVGDFVGVFFT